MTYLNMYVCSNKGLAAENLECKRFQKENCDVSSGGKQAAQ